MSFLSFSPTTKSHYWHTFPLQSCSESRATSVERGWELERDGWLTEDGEIPHEVLTGNFLHCHQILCFQRKKPTLEPNSFHEFSPHYYENSREIISFMKNMILMKQFFIHWKLNWTHLNGMDKTMVCIFSY